QWLASAYAVTFVHVHILATRNQILALFPTLGNHQHLPGASLKAPEFDHAVNFRNDRLLLGLPGFKQLGHTRQPASNILGFRRLTWNLRQRIPRRDIFPLNHRNMGAGWQQVTSNGRVTLISDRNTRLPLLVMMIENHFL